MHLPTFIVYEECIRGQGVLVVRHVLQYVCQIHVHSNYTQQQVSKVAWPADGHYETYKWKKQRKFLLVYPHAKSNYANSNS